MKKPRVITDFPVAYESNDHINPKGTVNDNTKNEAYVRELVGRFGQNMQYMDLGCAGGGFVSQFLERGILAVGIEGSDHNLKNKRAEWAVWPDYLFTADITQPFTVQDENGEKILFDAISAFDVLEHIPETPHLDGLLTNVTDHLKVGGVFVVSIATFPDEGYHVTLQEKPWWSAKFEKYNLKEAQTLKQFGRWSSICAVYEKVQ